MPRICSICTHPQRAEIEAAIVAGTSKRDIALHFEVGHMAVQRHASEHIQAAIKQSHAAKEEAQALDVVKQLKTINAVTLAILQEARNEKKNGLALFAVDRVLKQLELQAKLLGDLDERPQVNIFLSSDWQSIRTTLLQTLLPYQEARIAVAAALAGMEDVRASLN